MNFGNIVQEELNSNSIQKTIQSIKDQLAIVNQQIEDEKGNNETLKQQNQKLVQQLKQLTGQQVKQDAAIGTTKTIKKGSVTKTNPPYSAR